MRFTNLDAKQVSRFVLILVQANLVIQTKGKILFATFILQQEYPEYVLQTFSQINTANTLYDLVEFNKIFQNIVTSVSVLLDSQFKNQNLENTIQQVSNFQACWKPEIFIETLIKYNLIEIKIVGKRKIFIKKQADTKQFISPNFSIFTPIFAPTRVVKLHSLDILQATHGQGLVLLIKQYFTHESTKMSTHLKPMLEANYHMKINESGLITSLKREQHDNSEICKDEAIDSDTVPKGDRAVVLKTILDNVQFIEIFQLFHILQLKIYAQGDFVKIDNKYRIRFLQQCQKQYNIQSVTINGIQFLFLKDNGTTEESIANCLNKENTFENQYFLNSQQEHQLYLLDTIKNLSELIIFNKIFRDSCFYVDSLLAYLTPQQLINIDYNLGICVLQNICEFTQRQMLNTPVILLPIDLQVLILKNYQDYIKFKSFITIEIKKLLQLGFLEQIPLKIGINDFYIARINNTSCEKIAIRIRSVFQFEVTKFIDKEYCSIIEDLTFINKTEAQYFIEYSYQIQSFKIPFIFANYFYQLLTILNQQVTKTFPFPSYINLELDKNLIIDTEYNEIIQNIHNILQIQNFCPQQEKLKIKKYLHNVSGSIIHIEQLQIENITQNQILVTIIKLKQQNSIRAKKAIYFLNQKRFLPFDLDNLSQFHVVINQDLTTKSHHRQKSSEELSKLHQKRVITHVSHIDNKEYLRFSSLQRINKSVISARLHKMHFQHFKPHKLNIQYTVKKQHQNTISTKVSLPFSIKKSIFQFAESTLQLKKGSWGEYLNLRDTSKSPEIYELYVQIIKDQTVPKDCILQDFFYASGLLTKDFKLPRAIRYAPFVKTFKFDHSEASGVQLSILQDLALVRNVLIFDDKTVKTSEMLAQNDAEFVEIEAEIANSGAFPFHFDLKITAFDQKEIDDLDTSIMSLQNSQQIAVASVYDDILEQSQFSLRRSSYKGGYEEGKNADIGADQQVKCELETQNQVVLLLNEQQQESLIQKFTCNEIELVGSKNGFQEELPEEFIRDISICILDFIYVNPGNNVMSMLCKFFMVLPVVIIRVINVLSYDFLVEIRDSRGYVARCLTGKVEEESWTLRTSYENYRRFVQQE
eukprot:EST48303.1 Hypothetical protein SS50377_11502 [Spironucleus salmonicida]